MITVWVNEKKLEIEEQTTICQLLQIVNSPFNGIAVAVNNQVLSRNTWESHQFKNNDNILIIKATQGG